MVQNQLCGRTNTNGIISCSSWTASRSPKTPPAIGPPLKQEFEPKLDQPGIRARRGGGDHAEIGVVCRAANRVGRGKLRAIENIKELGTEFDPQPLVGGKPRALEDREVEVIDALGAQARVYA